MPRVRDVMTSRLYCLQRQMTLDEAVREFDHRSISGAPVVDEQGALCGHLSRTTILHRLSRSDRPLGDWKVDEAMEDVAYEVSPDDSVKDLLAVMLPSRIHRMVVTDDEGRPAGIVTSMDLMGCLFDLLSAQEAGN